MVDRRATLKSKLTGQTEPLDDTSNRLVNKLSTANLTRSARSRLFALQQARLHKTFDRAVTHTAYSSSFAQADSLRIGQRSLLTGNRIIVPGCAHAILIPPLSLSSTVSESVQHGCNLIVPIANRHATNDLYSLHRRR